MISAYLNSIPFSTDTLIKVYRDSTSKKIADYKDPDSSIIGQLNLFFTALKNEDVSQIMKLSNDLKLKAVRFNEKADNGQDNTNVVFYIPMVPKNFHITIMWRFCEADPLFFECPHEPTDNTTLSSIFYMMNTNARCMWSNAIHPHLGAYKNGRYASDGAHNVGTMFCKTQVILEKLYPDAFYVQLHGQKGAPNFIALFVNCYNCTFTRKNKSGPRIFLSVLPKYLNREACSKMCVGSELNKYGDLPDRYYGLPLTDKVGGPTNYAIYKRLMNKCHNTTVEAHLLNGGSQTSKGKEDTGRFMHFEQSPQIRTKHYEQFCRPIAKAFNETMIIWKNWPKDNLRSSVMEVEDCDVCNDNTDCEDSCEESMTTKLTNTVKKFLKIN